MMSLWRVGVLLSCLVATSARAQEGALGGMLDLPLVIHEGGWARYEGTSSDGPSRFVFKVGAKGRHRGQRGRWMLLDVEVPSVGRLSFHFLVKGERFGTKDILLMKVFTPGQRTREIAQPFKEDTPPKRQGRFLQKRTETVAGRTMEILEYSFPSGVMAEWSQSVPGMGLVRLGGADPFHLVDFGVGGDPWKEKAPPAMFPVAPKKP
ncbi:hypothetical protein LZ198_25010 [Myxococcus sp. K15C18031901]|uniref:hypothetical protein n=1 Tax=Myxococcus dinghuensis TaxID=2906761 RepID=UPI0020A73CC0|nr:hypothetical protein [Myxococcus dinghuensis]MCP3102133.1 hypothetical protein [Myxococcus dinghuensis]